MADYYSLLSRAIAALPQSSPEARRTVYDRARKALFNQLRSIQPPVPEADIEAEGRALDEAIARLELEAVREQTPFAPGKTARAGEQPAPSGGGGDTAEIQALSLQAQRPAAPPPARRPASNIRRVWAIAAVLVVIAGLVAVIALQLRERPEDLARLQPEAASPEQAEGGKIAERAVGVAGQEPGAARPPAEPAQDAPAIPVAQKAEMWVAAPEEANKVKIYSGTVVWRLDNAGGEPGQALMSAIRGDVDIPEAKLKLQFVIQKNLDATLSASHTINVSFLVGPGAEVKGVKAIGSILMRRPEAQSGEQVAGMAAAITENNFLIGLMPGDREARNLALLRAPAVVELPVQLLDGRAAAISMEKGPVGERVFAEALQAWARP